MVGGCLKKGIIRFFGFILVFGGIIVLAIIWPQFGKWLEEGAVWPYKAENYQITYFCGGGEILTDWASINWINGKHKTEIGDYHMPFRVTYTMHYGDEVQISARSGSSFSLRCGFNIDGRSWKSAENSGQDVTIESSGIVGHK